MNQSDNSVFVIYREGSFSFEGVSQTLEMVPDRASVGGEKGKNTVWKLFASNKDLGLEDQLENWVSILTSKTNELKKLKDDGWRIELDCLIQPDGGAAIVSFESELLRKLSNLHVSLIVRVWN